MRQMLFWEALVLSAFLLYLSRTYTIALYMFLPLYFFLVYHILSSEENTLKKLTALSILTAVSLSLRFDYLIWGDPWADYAVNKGILESKLFPLNNEEPLARFITIFASLLTGIDPMTAQKFLIPALSSLAAPILYVFMQDFMPKRGALYSGLLLMVATPYLHWVTQGVRESLGLFIVTLALYLSYRAVKEPSRKTVLPALLSTAALPMTHPRATLIFLAAWVGFSFFYLIHDPSKKKSFYAALIAILALSYSFRWWTITDSRGFSAIKQFLSSYYNIGILEVFLIVCAGLIFLYLLTALFKLPLDMWLTKKKKLIYYSGLAVGFIMLIYMIIFVKKNLALPYPVFYLTGSFILISLSVVGIYSLLEKGRTQIIGWMLGVSLLLVFNLALNYGNTVTQYTSPAGDLLRPFAHIAIPLAAMAGVGFFFIEKKTRIQRFRLIFAFIISISLITSFPSIVFTDKTFTKNSPLIYDERSWLISHTYQEIASVNWLRNYHLLNYIRSDRYIEYVLRPTGLVGIEDRDLSRDGYILITKRMLQITDFGEMIYSKRKGLDTQKINELEEKTDRIYSNDYTDIYI